MSSSDEFALPHSILRHFDLASSPYSESVVSRINQRRRSYPNQKLFIDHLFAFADVDGPSLYPPATPADLRRLLRNIQSCSADRLKRDCFIYYLLRDYEVPSQREKFVNGNTNGDENDNGMNVDSDVEDVHGATRAQKFMWKRCMPKAWATFIDGYWALDHGLWDVAVSSLSDPRITEVNCMPEILKVLSTHVSPPSSACAYIHSLLSTTGRQLTTLSSASSSSSPLLLLSQTERDIGLIATASTSGLSSAFSIIRNYDETSRSRAREDVWCWALGVPRITCGSGSHIPQAKALKELLHLPLNDEEHAHLVQFLSHPPRSIPPPALALLHDLVALRLIHQGQYAETLQLDRALAGRGADEERQRRREMVREFIDILPEAQKRVLRIESDAAARRSEKEPTPPVLSDPAAVQVLNPAAMPSSAPNGHVDVEMSNSWVHVFHEATAQPSSTTSPTPQHHIPNSAAPTPIAPVPTRHNLLQESARPSSPARTGSPFSGPPRFAPSAPPIIPPPPIAPVALAPPSQTQPNLKSTTTPIPARITSPVKHASSPFVPPPSVKEVHVNCRSGQGRGGRQPRKMIVDDEEPLTVVPSRKLARQKQNFVDEYGEYEDQELGGELPPALESSAIQVEPQEEVNAVETHETIAESVSKSQTTVPGKKSRRVTSVPREPSLPPATPVRRSSRAKQVIAPTALASLEPESERQAEMPPPPAAITMSIPGSFITSPITSTAGTRTPRARMTRSASRAFLDDTEEHEATTSTATPAAQSKRVRSTKSTANTSTGAGGGTAKRSTRAQSEVTDDGGSVYSVTRRSTRRGGTVDPSERGSPTPSVASSVARSETGRRRTQSSTTPRATRSRK